MKKISKLLLGLTLSSLLFIGCSKDEDEKTSGSGNFSIAGQSYDLPNGMLENYGAWGAEGVYNVDLVFYSDGITIDEDSESGKGHYIYFEILTDTEGDLSEGTYTYSLSNEAGTFDAADYAINFDLETYEADKNLDIVDGSLSVSKSNNIYTITISVTDEAGDAITGTYTGPLAYYDYSVEEYSAATTSLKSEKSKKAFLIK